MQMCSLRSSAYGCAHRGRIDVQIVHLESAGVGLANASAMGFSKGCFCETTTPSLPSVYAEQ